MTPLFPPTDPRRYVAHDVQAVRRGFLKYQLKKLRFVVAAVDELDPRDSSHEAADLLVDLIAQAGLVASVAERELLLADLAG